MFHLVTAVRTTVEMSGAMKWIPIIMWPYLQKPKFLETETFRSMYSRCLMLCSIAILSLYVFQIDFEFTMLGSEKLNVLTCTHSNGD